MRYEQPDLPKSPSTDGAAWHAYATLHWRVPLVSLWRSPAGGWSGAPFAPEMSRSEMEDHPHSRWGATRDRAARSVLDATRGGLVPSC
jgi:hypothetical protein